MSKCITYKKFSFKGLQDSEQVELTVADSELRQWRRDPKQCRHSRSHLNTLFGCLSVHRLKCGVISRFTAGVEKTPNLSLIRLVSNKVRQV
jgi:hypothetical protein